MHFGNAAECLLISAVRQKPSFRCRPLCRPSHDPTSIAEGISRTITQLASGLATLRHDASDLGGQIVDVFSRHRSIRLIVGAVRLQYLHLRRSHLLQDRGDVIVGLCRGAVDQGDDLVPHQPEYQQPRHPVLGQAASVERVCPDGSLAGQASITRLNR